jgi:hypothetical protein
MDQPAGQIYDVSKKPFPERKPAARPAKPSWDQSISIGFTFRRNFGWSRRRSNQGFFFMRLAKSTTRSGFAEASCAGA